MVLNYNNEYIIPNIIMNFYIKNNNIYYQHNNNICYHQQIFIFL